MELTFIGHQSWMISDQNYNILVDPILLASFGASKYCQFNIVPSRSVDFRRLPPIDAIFLTTEHIQHFQPRTFASLKGIDSNPRIYVHPIFPKCAIDVLEELGFSVTRSDYEACTSIGSLKLSFHPNLEENLPWDIRVCSLLIESDFESVFIQSDSKPPKSAAEKLNSSRKRMLTIIATNNTFRTSHHQGAGLTNILPVRNSDNFGYVGVQALINTLHSPYQAFPLAKNFILSGGGYNDTIGVMSPPKWTHQDLASTANELSLGTKVHAPLPGKVFDTQNENWVDSGWIKQTDCNPKACEQDSWWKMGVLNPQIEGAKLLEDIDRELGRLSKALVMSDFGRQLLRVDEYLNRPLCSKRFIIQLEGSREDSLDLIFDMSTASFHKSEYSGDTAVRNFPFGIRVKLNDFIALFQGRSQIWEVATISARQWYLSSNINSPMAFLFEYFDESVQQGLSARVYKADLELFNPHDICAE